MKSLMEIFTPLTRELQVLNHEIRQKLSYMPYYTEQEIENLEAWSEEVRVAVKSFDDISLIISRHLELFEIKLRERRQEASSKHKMGVRYLLGLNMQHSTLSCRVLVRL